ncbi:MAG: hypothetical protein KKD31_17755 [Bacteroidetes bacterium]|nr:hypothetical protein [Bacteroidota bacterium]
MHILQLSDDKLQVLSSEEIAVSTAGNYGDGRFEFVKDQEALFYSQRGVYAEGTTNSEKNTWKYQKVSPT